MFLCSLRARATASLLTLVLLGGVFQSRADSEASSAETTFSIATASKVAPATGTTSSLNFANATLDTFSGLTINNGIVSVVPATPGLFGSVTDLQFKSTKGGATRAKATVGLVNTSGTALRNVSATVYLSDDNTLSADDTKIVTLDLSDYVAKGKIGKHGTFDLPLNYKVPTVLKSYVEGKYLIVVLSADNLGTLETTPIVVGPITLP